MDSRGWDALIISGTDPHSSEYPAPRWKQVEWLSGFTGEAGDIVITADHAGLWTDSRYFIQANTQLKDSSVELHKTRQPDSVYIPQWLAEQFADCACTIALDGLCQSCDAVKELKEAVPDCEIADVPDLLDIFWEDRPEIPVTPIVTLSAEQAGESRADRIAWLRNFLQEKACSYMLLTSLDEIAWLLNVRGNDIDYNPLVISYLLVSQDRVDWFVIKDDEEFDDETSDSFAELSADGINILRYDEIFSSLAPGGRIYTDPATLNYSVCVQLAAIFGDDILYGTSPVILAKAVKNPVEIESQREAYLEDGLAMEKFLFWLENVVQSREVSEWEASVKLTSLRSEIPGYRGNSFENISAYGPNAALPHYVTPCEGSAILQPKGLYLVDSGGQYIFGTTDITRTIPMGECTPLEKEDYTLVLKGMIDLAMAVFPAGTAGCQIDALARLPLWRNFRNFGHGTGHGTGFWLCVHEGPQSIRQNFNTQPLLPGMITSDEPGIYREGLHGVRHENIVLCTELLTNDFGKWYGFETLTVCHIDTDAIVPELLTPEEIDWLNSYNASVYEKLSPRLSGEILFWLQAKTEAI